MLVLAIQVHHLGIVATAVSLTYVKAYPNHIQPQI
jgi:hypothetical protein